MSTARKNKRTQTPRHLKTLQKASTGISGLDTITSGGLPRGRPTLVCGGPGCGKTVLGVQFIINGARLGENGVIVSFEETGEDLAKNIASLGADLNALVRQKKVAIDYIQVDRSEIVESGGYDLSGLFVRIAQAIESVGAKRILLDTLEVLFASFTNEGVMRAELERLFRWLKDQGITAVVTGERGDTGLTRHGLEEYVSDCVIALDNRVTEQLTTRRIRIVKYRGSTHGTNEYPFLIDSNGISVLPITSLGLDYPVSNARVSSGNASLDDMLEGKGYFRGSSVLISGTAGTGKSSVAASFAVGSAARNERCLYFALEEPAGQVVRNMRSIGLELAPLVDKGLLTIVAARPTVFGLEQHLVAMHQAIEREKPRAVIVDPISSLVTGSNFHEVKSVVVRLFDHLKQRGITGIFTYLSGPAALEQTELGVSSLIDTWIEVRDLEHAGERNRALYILKSRGMAHSNQVRELLITSHGIELVDAFVGPHGVVTGSARLTQEAEFERTRSHRQLEIERNKRDLQRRRMVTESKIAALRAELASAEEDTEREVSAHTLDERAVRENRLAMRQTRLGAGSGRRENLESQ